jgi:glutathione-regulated potassium-efflux system ancillary protein KefC/glutathione-regulated potassium-efflux system protein KefB
MQQRHAKAASDANYDTIDTQESQVILAGFGRIGQVVARVLRLKKIPFTALDGNYEQVDFVRRFGGKVYFGDASRLDLLRTAGLEHAKIFVLAVDDVESSVKIAELVKRYYPHLKIYARARNRQHVYRLRDIGVDVVIREAFYSSLEMSRQLLTEFGATDEEAMTLMERFRIHDEKVLLKQQQFHHDEKKLIAATKQALIELEDLFEQDVVIAGKKNGEESDSR